MNLQNYGPFEIAETSLFTELGTYAKPSKVKMNASWHSLCRGLLSCPYFILGEVETADFMSQKNTSQFLM